MLDDLGLPAGPFTTATARDAGLGAAALREAVTSRRLRRVLRGVYVDAATPDDLGLRVAAVRLVVPPHAVVVDRTAAWLHGVDVLRRSSVHETPPVEVYAMEGTRLRRGTVDSGNRRMIPADLVDLGGLTVTTPLRTCLDLARLLWRYDALGAVDQFLAHGLMRQELMDELVRFRGFRWVTQARRLIPLGDPRAESMPESALRLHWYDALSVTPEPQVWVQDADGIDRFRLDLADRGMRYAAEYDGQEFHTRVSDRVHDAERRAWCRERDGWEIDVFGRRSVYGLDPHPVGVLRTGWERTRQLRGLRPSHVRAPGSRTS